MQNSESHTHILFSVQSSTKYKLEMLTLPASTKASYVSASSSTRPGGKVACGKESTSTSGDAFPWGAWPRDAAVDTHKQAGRQSTALTRASLRSGHVTKRFRILATLKQGTKSMYSNTSGYVHMGLRLDWGKGITGQ